MSVSPRPTAGVGVAAAAAAGDVAVTRPRAVLDGRLVARVLVPLVPARLGRLVGRLALVRLLGVGLRLLVGAGRDGLALRGLVGPLGLGLVERVALVLSLLRHRPSP